ncbi:MAG: hypothetical protein ACHQNA_11880, partial [Acidimicrobiales bacterium]
MADIEIVGPAPEPPPTLIVSDYSGRHNQDLPSSIQRLERGKAYRDLSTVIVVPTRGTIPARAVENWMGLMMPMNHPVVRVFVPGMEVGAAYEAAFSMILAHPVLSKWKYILTLEEDNLPPPDGLLKLYEHIEDWAAVGGLYWTKGEAGQPMIYGDPTGILDFVPQKPKEGELQECNGLGMGFTLFRLDLFRDDKLPRPWFQTLQRYEPS